MKCSNCESERIIPYAHLFDGGNASVLQLAITENPKAGVFKGWHMVEVVGTVCCDCGRVSFTAIGDLEAAWKAFEKNHQQVAMPEAVVIEAPQESENQ